MLMVDGYGDKRVAWEEKKKEKKKEKEMVLYRREPLVVIGDKVFRPGPFIES